MCVAQAQVIQSVAIKIRRFMPDEVGQTNPVKVWTRRGTRANQADNIQMSPALGVIEWTITGRSRRMTRHIFHNDFKSLIREMCRSMGTAIVRTPSRISTRSKASPGEDTATTSYSLDNSLSIPLQKVSNDCGTVDALINFFFFFELSWLMK